MGILRFKCKEGSIFIDPGMKISVAVVNDYSETKNIYKSVRIVYGRDDFQVFFENRDDFEIFMREILYWLENKIEDIQISTIEKKILRSDKFKADEDEDHDLLECILGRSRNDIPKTGEFFESISNSLSN